MVQYKIYIKVRYPQNNNPRKIGLFSCIFFENNQEAFEISKCYKGTSAVRLEILALIDIIEMIEKYYIQGKFIFYTNSEIVSKSVNIWMKNWAKKGWDICGKKNADLWRIVHRKWNRHKFEMKFSKKEQGKFIYAVERLSDTIIEELKAGKEILHQDNK